MSGAYSPRGKERMNDSFSSARMNAGNLFSLTLKTKKKLVLNTIALSIKLICGEGPLFRGEICYMLKQISVSNLGCFDDQTHRVDFSEETLLAGPNNSGKSMLLAGMNLFKSRQFWPYFITFLVLCHFRHTQEDSETAEFKDSCASAHIECF